mgnify:CR=1 FL=1|jgi:hypothetical protein
MQYKKLSNYSKYLFSEDGNIYRIRKYNCFITLCNDYPKACQKEAKGVRPESVGENPLNGSTQPLSNKGDDIV